MPAKLPRRQDGGESQKGESAAGITSQDLLALINKIGVKRKAYMSHIKLEPGERVIFSSRRRGPAGYSQLAWFGILFLGMQVCGSCTMVFYYASGVLGDMPGGVTAPSILTVLLALGLFVYWLLERNKPYYFLTSKRLIVRRFFLSPLELEVTNIGAAARRVVSYMRYGRVVREDVTNRIALAFYTGGSRLIGPVEDAEDLVNLLKCVIDHSIDLSALPSTTGDPAPAELRKDLFLARTTTAAGVPRGPLFIGPAKIVAFADVFFKTRDYQLLSIVGAPKSAEDVEQRMLDLAKNSAWGRAIVMEREGMTLTLEQRSLRMSSGEHAVVFELNEADAARARQFLKTNEAHPYR
jgi:hypothetical protein